MDYMHPPTYCKPAEKKEDEKKEDEKKEDEKKEDEKKEEEKQEEEQKQEEKTEEDKEEEKAIRPSGMKGKHSVDGEATRVEHRAELLSQGAQLPERGEEELDYAPPAQPQLTPGQEVRRAEQQEQLGQLSAELIDLGEQCRIAKERRDELAAVVADIDEQYETKLKELREVEWKINNIADL